MPPLTRPAGAAEDADADELQTQRAQMAHRGVRWADSDTGGAHSQLGDGGQLVGVLGPSGHAAAGDSTALGDILAELGLDATNPRAQALLAAQPEAAEAGGGRRLCGKAESFWELKAAKAEAARVTSAQARDGAEAAERRRERTLRARARVWLVTAAREQREGSAQAEPPLGVQQLLAMLEQSASRGAELVPTGGVGVRRPDGEWVPQEAPAPSAAPTHPTPRAATPSATPPRSLPPRGLGRAPSDADLRASAEGAAARASLRRTSWKEAAATNALLPCTIETADEADARELAEAEAEERTAGEWNVDALLVAKPPDEAQTRAEAATEETREEREAAAEETREEREAAAAEEVVVLSSVAAAEEAAAVEEEEEEEEEDDDDEQVFSTSSTSGGTWCFGSQHTSASPPDSAPSTPPTRQPRAALEEDAARAEAARAEAAQAREAAEAAQTAAEAAKSEAVGLAQALAQALAGDEEAQAWPACNTSPRGKSTPPFSHAPPCRLGSSNARNASSL